MAAIPCRLTSNQRGALEAVALADDPITTDEIIDHFEDTGLSTPKTAAIEEALATLERHSLVTTGDENQLYTITAAGETTMQQLPRRIIEEFGA